MMPLSKRQIVVWLAALLVMAATLFALASVNSATIHDARADRKSDKGFYAKAG